MKERKKYTEQELGRYLRENRISPTEAVDIIQKYDIPRQSLGEKMLHLVWFIYLGGSDSLLDQSPYHYVNSSV